jgi:lipid-A-disaccharide synthase-like uncharacterized protein
MNSILAIFHLFGHAVVLTPWKLIGYAGSLAFGGRWIVQVIASRKHGKPMMPPLFWYMSVGGNLLLLSYFIFGKNDSVGILSNIFPTAINFYNLYLDATHRRGPKPV